jgi:hypothetical protein
MLQFDYDFIDKYIDRSDFELLEMDTDSYYFAFSKDSIEKLINPHMREEYEKHKFNFLPSDSNESHDSHPPFQDRILHMLNSTRKHLDYSRKKKQQIK